MSRRNRGPLGVVSLMWLALLSGPALAEGADAAPNPERDSRGRPLRNNPQTPPIQPQARPDGQGDRDYRNRRDGNRDQERARSEQRSREQRSAEERARSEERARLQQRAREEQAREDRARNERARDQRSADRRRDNDWRDRDGRSSGWSDRGWHGPSYASPYRRHVWVDRHRFDVRPDRRRVYRNVVVLRPYGHWYYGYGRYYRDVDAYRWLGLTAITFGILNYLNEQQQRALEDAQIAATTSPIGAPIIWQDSEARGTVVASRDGWSDTGQYCREFQQTVEIGGQIEQAYGTACQQPDGAWQVTSQ